MKYRLIFGVCFLICLCIWEGTTNDDNSVGHKERIKRDTDASQSNMYGSETDEIVYIGGEYGREPRRPPRRQIFDFDGELSCDNLPKLLEQIERELGNQEDVATKLERLANRINPQKEKEKLMKECTSEGNFFNEKTGRCYFVTKSPELFQTETCSSEKAGSNLASIITDALYQDLVYFMRNKIEEGKHEIRAWTWGIYDPTIGDDNKKIRWGDGKSSTMEDSWFPNTPFTVDKKDRYADYTRIVMAVHSNESYYQGLYNLPENSFKVSLCEYV